MRIKAYQWTLLVIFILVFASRAYITTQSDFLSDDSSYFVLRQIENIAETGFPIFEDDLSYGGRTFLFSPLFHYTLAGIYIIFKSTVALKLFLNLLASTLIFGAYLISEQLTKSRKAALFTALVAGFIPIYFQQTVNSLSVFSITLPLTFFSIYFLMKLKENKRCSKHFIILMFILIIMSATSVILILGLLFFLLLAKIEKIKLEKSNYEIVLVSTFLYLWFVFILFKRAILFHGSNIIYQNVPNTYLLQYFSQINILEAVYLIGIIPFLFGIYSAYNYVTKQRSLQSTIILGVAFSIFFLLWFKLIPLKTGLIFLGAVLTLLVSQFFEGFFSYIKRTRFDRLLSLIYILVVVIIIMTSALPSISLGLNTLSNVPSQQTVESYAWLKLNTNENDTVLTSENRGHFLTYFSKNKNVMDDNFLFIKNIDQRLNDVRRIYITRFSQEALELSNKYGITHIVMDDAVKRDYGVESLFYADTSNCFTLVYGDQVKIYKVECK